MVVRLFFKLHSTWQNVEQNKSQKQLNVVYFYIHYIIASKLASEDNIIMCSLSIHINIYKKKRFVEYFSNAVFCNIKTRILTLNYHEYER